MGDLPEYPPFPGAEYDAWKTTEPEERGSVCEGCGSRGPSDDLGSDGLCYPCHEAILEDEAMRDEDEAREDAYWRHVNNKIDAARGK